MITDNQKINLNLKADSYLLPPLVQSLDLNLHDLVNDRLTSTSKYFMYLNVLVNDKYASTSNYTIVAGSCNALQSGQASRTRGEKRPIPDEQKDER